MTQPAEPLAPQPSAAMPPPPAPAIGVAATNALPADQLTAAYKAGALQFRQGERVPVRLSDGSLGTVDATDAPGVVDEGGSIVPHDVVHQAELEAKYGGLGGGVGAFAAGAARGATVGLSDPLALALAEGVGGHQAREDLRERLGAYQEFHPYASGAGEVLGVVAPALASGGAGAGGLLARGLAAPAEGVSLLGRAAERGAGALLGGAAETTLGRIAAKAGAGAAEGAIFGVGNEVSEASLGDHELTAEKLLAGAGHGAMLGGLVGGGVGAVGEAAQAVRVKASPFLAAKADEEAFRSLNARVKFTKEAEKIPGGPRAIGRRLLDDGVIRAGDDAAAIAPKVEAAKEKAFSVIEAETAKVADATVSLKDVTDALEKRAAGFEKDLGYEAAASSIRRVRDDIAKRFGAVNAAGEVDLGKTAVHGWKRASAAEAFDLTQGGMRPLSEDLAASAGMKLGPRGELLTKHAIPGAESSAANIKVPLGDLLEARRSLEGTIDWMREGSVVTQGKRAVGRTLEDIVVDHGERVSGGFGDAYKAAKLQWRQMKVASDAVADAVARSEANASHSLTDKLFAGHGLAIGATHGPLGAVAGLVAGQASKLARTRGNSTLAVMYDKLSGLQAIAKRTASVDATIARGVKGWEERARGLPASTPPRPKLPRGAVEEYRARVADLGAGESVNHAEPMAPVAAHAPNVAGAFEQRARSATQYLKSQVPPENKWGSKEPNQQAQFEFLMKARAVDAPAETVASGLARGTITKPEVDAVKAVYPKLLDQIQVQVNASMAKLLKEDRTVPYEMRRDLALLFGEETDWSMTAAGVKTLQDNAQATAQQQKQQEAARRKAVTTPGATLSQTDTERRQGGQIR